MFKKLSPWINPHTHYILVGIKGQGHMLWSLSCIVFNKNMCAGVCIQEWGGSDKYNNMYFRKIWSSACVTR
jgi:hypothetical protein